MASGFGKDDFQFTTHNSPNSTRSSTVTTAFRPTSDFSSIPPNLPNPTLQQLFGQHRPQNETRKLAGATKKKKGAVTGKFKDARRLGGTGIYYFDHPHPLIAHTATSRIYYGYHNTPDKRAAIKSVISRYDDENDDETYQNELHIWLTATETLAKENINIVQLFAFDWWKDEQSRTISYCFAMELATCDLEKRIKDLKRQGANLESDEILYRKLVGYLEDIANGLCWLHKRGIIHRDIKPQNSLIFNSAQNDTETAKLADFGISRAMTNPSLGTDSAGRGTLIWMPPEAIIAMEKRVTFKNTKSIDVFSLGATFHYVMSLGEHPFAIGDKCEPDDIKDSNIKDPRVEPHQLAADKLLSANHLCQWMMRQERSERPSMSQVLNHCFFYSKEKCLQFVIDYAVIVANKEPKAEAEKLVREKVDRAFTQFYLSHKNIRNFDWGQKLGESFVRQITLKKSTGKSKEHTYSKTSASSLATLMRDKTMHLTDIAEDLVTSEQYFGEKEVGEDEWRFFSKKKYASFFFKMFPELVPVLWTTLATGFNKPSIADALLKPLKHEYNLNDFRNMYNIFQCDLNSDLT